MKDDRLKKNVYRAGKSSSVLLFCPNSAKSPQSPLQLVNGYFIYGGSGGSASAYQPVDSGFESRLRSTFDKAENIRCLAGVLLFIQQMIGGTK